MKYNYEKYLKIYFIFEIGTFNFLSPSSAFLIFKKKSFSFKFYYNQLTFIVNFRQTF